MLIKKVNKVVVVVSFELGIRWSRAPPSTHTEHILSIALNWYREEAWSIRCLQGLALGAGVMTKGNQIEQLGSCTVRWRIWTPNLRAAAGQDKSLKQELWLNVYHITVSPDCRFRTKSDSLCTAFECVVCSRLSNH